MNKIILPICILLIFSHGLTAADIPDEKKQEIRRMIQLSGIDRSMDNFKTQLLNALRSEMPNQPATFWDQIEKKMDTNDLLERLMPVYDKYYTLDDLKAINAFYESPVGQKMFTSLPELMDESSRIAQNWGDLMHHMAMDEANATSAK